MSRALSLAALAVMVALVSAVPRPAAAQQAIPFDGDLRRLSEILGALHYLREVCGANEGQKWRNEMQQLVDAEASSG
ncbi:TIGR02301 family protein, partial [Rhodoplanes roseus]|uniref:TIGR02301 family protein n=1 Tax=Rhodoplanes roseus TaxID=29409 RepID=UPI003CCAFE45